MPRTEVLETFGDAEIIMDDIFQGRKWEMGNRRCGVFGDERGASFLRMECFSQKRED